MTAGEQSARSVSQQHVACRSIRYCENCLVRDQLSGTKNLAKPAVLLGSQLIMCYACLWVPKVVVQCEMKKVMHSRGNARDKTDVLQPCDNI